ncbi:MAG: sialate O-acetylesterase [Ruminococcus sp.]|nr:sialate O-acetylesterase [Ruminococcus sp.]
MKLAAVFKDYMVLQRDKEIRIFGTCNNGDHIVVSLDGVLRNAQTDGTEFIATFPPMEKKSDVELYVTNGLETITRKNIAIGEVWLAGGQSNMELTLAQAKDGEKYIEQAKSTRIRYYNVPRMEYENDELLKAEANSEWTLGTSDAVKDWSAVAYHFAKRLEEELDVVVGIIGCNLGGTSASCWVDRKTLEQNEITARYVSDYDKKVGDKTPEQQIKDYEEYKVYQAGWNERLGKFYAENPNGSWEDALKCCGENRWPGPMGLSNLFRLSGLYDIMLSRVAPITLRGFIFYQGEEDTAVCERYDALFNTLISAWRRYFDDAELPFICVSLPMMGYSNAPDDKTWPIVREAQQNAAIKNKNVYTAIALDCGELDNIHPTDKLPVGNRLALLTLNKVYNIDCNADAPTFDSFIYDGGKAIISFKNANGLTLKFGDKPLGFEISTDGESFSAADAHIAGDKIEISCDKPVVAVRYQWVNYGEVNLFSENGLPVASFRSAKD